MQHIVLADHAAVVGDRVTRRGMVADYAEN